ncbi:MAG: VOC family protein [Anaerolineales bacterium]|nr:VOC family protein [Anaerolineales bacterium]
MAEAPITGLAQIGQVSLTVHQLERAIAFYRDHLGMRFLFQTPNLAFFDCQGVRLMLSLPERGAFDHPSLILYFLAPDIHAWSSELARRGVEFTSPPHLVAKMPDHDLWMAFFADTEGNTLALMSEVPHG